MFSSLRKSSRSEQKELNRGRVDLHGTVTYDFSDWPIEKLNLTTTSNVVGIRPGTLRIQQDEEDMFITCEKGDVGTGSDIVYIYKWCCKQAGEENEDMRRFFFENGKYVGSALKDTSPR